MDDNTSKVYVEPDSSQPPLVPPNGSPGTQLFVINLCASIAPVSTTGRNMPGLENYKLYQVARVEDGRTRHRLRLGFFTNEAHAERVLTVVRQQYPTAFTTSLGDEDRRFARGYLPERSAPAPAPRPAVAVVNTPAPAPVAAAPAPKAAPAPVAAKPAPAPAAQPAVQPAVAKPAAAAKAPAPTPKPSQPAKAAVKAPVEEIVEMTWEPDEETKAAVTSASLPKIKALTEAVGLDEMSWDDEPAPTLTPAPAKEPLAVGLLSGKFAALDTTKLKVSKAATPAPVAAKPATPPAPVAAKPVTPPAPQAVPPKLDTAASVRVPALTFSDPAPTPASAQKSNAAPNEPYHVGKGVRIEEVDAFELDLYDDAPATPAAQQPPAAAAKKGAPAKPAAKPAAPVAKKPEPPVAKPAAPAAAKPAAPMLKPVPPAPVRESSLKHPNLDSTQTIRALTTEELNDGAQEKWFAIQLAASEQPVNLDTMPHLDIFEAYSLYSVATAGSGKIVHSLRLGFFKEAVSAEAVAGYLKTFFASPSVLRISVAEQARFKDAPQPRRADPEEPKNNVVELNNARANRAPVVPTVTMEVDPSATGAFRPNATGAFRPNATGALSSATGTFKPGATGAFKPNATGAFKANATGAFKLNGTGVHKALDTKVAAKSASPATKRSDPTGKHKSLKKSLAEELLEEAREVELSESGIRKLPQNNSLLSRLLGKKK
ncbi:MAG TPA: hypothetical protein VGD45_16955 [Steroidobacter sp.]|uniref:hypothetical protein n=1 Tax=Steroidobacter sp. TaxID=1978227 RepID=UPI002ED9118F